MRLKKIVVIGPESSGKSTLCTLLAAHFHSVYCPEYARAYLTKYGTDYTYEDLLTIAKRQLELEDDFAKQVEVTQKTHEKEHYSASASNPLLFIDTDMYVMKVWCEFVFDKCHQWILDQITKRSYDLYLLCKPDLPWEPDPLREYPDEHRRMKLFHFYKDLLINQSTPWVEINGSYAERLPKAVAAVELFCKS